MRIEKDFQYSTMASGAARSALLSSLEQAGYSNTRARRAVVNALVESNGHASPAQLLDLGRNHHAALGLVTVYRTLDILLALGLVHRLHLEEGCHTYVISQAGLQNGDQISGHGHHIICQRCQRAVEFAGCDIDSVVSAVEAQTGFRVRQHWLELFGLCPECQAAAE